ncbi:MAG TPA: alpha-ketoacid dehydrogenase subunit beta, partial [archaeon]|nr:alpha-ketoacid dehydrogenase subunit beta [archaeon]
RVIDTPLAESGIVGTSIGLAIGGMKPIAEIQFDGFMYPALDQLISHASRLRTRSRGRFSCPMVLRAPYSGGVKALEHHSESPETYFLHTPGLKVVIPSTPYDAKGLIVSSIRDSDPVIFLEPKKLYRSIKQQVPTEEFTVPLGKANVFREGSDVTIITYGSMMRPSIDAAEQLKEGVSCEVVDLRTLKPLDNQTIFESVKKTGRVVIVQEAPRNCGFAAEISARIMENLFSNLKAPVQRVTGFDTVMPLPKLENYYLPDTNRIVKAVENVMKF